MHGHTVDPGRTNTSPQKREMRTQSPSIGRAHTIDEREMRTQSPSGATRGRGRRGSEGILTRVESSERSDARIVDALLAWFAREGRPWPWRATRDRWHVLVSEVCLQQTQVARAAPFVDRIMDRFPTPEDLAAADLGDLLVLWQGLGYPRRARNLWRAARHVTEHGWPDDLTLLPGVGPYTAAALACFADEQPVMPLDINTRRVIARLFPHGAPTVEAVPAIEGQCWAWAQAVMELGQRACRARAACDECPVATLCPSAGTGEIVASPRQRPYAGSMRERRGRVLRTLTDTGTADVAADAEAARSLVADGLASLSPDGTMLVRAGSRGGEA